MEGGRLLLGNKKGKMRENEVECGEKMKKNGKNPKAGRELCSPPPLPKRRRKKSWAKMGTPTT